MEKTISAETIAEMIQVLKALANIPYPNVGMEVDWKLAQDLRISRTKASNILGEIEQ